MMITDQSLTDSNHIIFFNLKRQKDLTMDTTSATDQLRIARHLLLSAPPGQFDHILTDLHEILPSEVTSDPNWAQAIQDEYNDQTGRKILLGEGEGEGDDKDFKIANDRGLDEGFKKYVERFYSSQGVTSNYRLFEGGDNNNKINVLLCAERVNFQQFHAGSWTSRYSIQFNDDGSKSVTMSGTINLHAHTFENGTLQLKSTVDLPEVTTTQDRIMKQIQKWDEDSVMSLHGVYDDMSDDILKKLRRVMPITRTKFDWNVQGHRGIRELGSQFRRGK